MKVGDLVQQSPVGSGKITDFSDRGYPRVNFVAVAWLVLESGEVYDPHGVKPNELEVRSEEQG